MSNEKTNAEPSGASGGSMAWIPVTERLPNHGGTVVCRTRQRELQFGRVMTVTEYKGGVATDSHHWRGYPDAPLEVTHWTPLPAPPTEFECPANDWFWVAVMALCLLSFILDRYVREC